MESKDIKTGNITKVVAKRSNEAGTGKAKRARTEKDRKGGTKNSKDVKRRVKGKDIFDTTPTSSSSAEPEAESEEEVLKSAMKEHYFIRDTLFNNLRKEYRRETGSAPTEKVNVVLTNPL